MNQDFVSKLTFYNGQQKVLKAVSQYANESMQKYLHLLQYGAIVCGDGRYPIRRNSSHCSFDIIDIKTGKIISLGIVDKLSKYHEDETLEGCSNLLESEAMKRAIEYLGNHKSKITGVVIDGDNKNSKLLQTEDFHPAIYRNHQLILQLLM